jgi:predicted GIY-YIG superfamily endonuclease
MEKPDGSACAPSGSVPQPEKRFVYILRSESNPSRHYVGLTAGFPNRLRWHNAGQNVHTARDRPWNVIVTLEFASEEAALPV